MKKGGEKMDQIFIESTLTVIAIIFLILFLYFALIAFRSLKKYMKSKDVRSDKKIIKKTLGECLKEHRIQCKVTQEFVAETIGVSRQTVSKWENGSSDPSTSNLFALAKLYGLSVQEILNELNE